jgi:RNA polymerase sigma factor (sigma-70 family)
VNKQDVEKIITEYLKPIFGFALKRCGNYHDAEDLAQEIVVKAFCALLAKDDIVDMGKFIWTVAHNTLNSYYREASRSMIGIPIDDGIELFDETHSETEVNEKTELLHRCQAEIAYLSKTQRRIVIAYYFEKRKLTDIAEELSIPIGTVKWHLFEAKRELKGGMKTMRETSELKFNPVNFRYYGIVGTSGKRDLNEFLRSALTQNICYCVRNTAKTIHEIADDLGVSPVYVETEVDFLEEYGLIKVEKDKYIVNFIIAEPTAELLAMQEDMYNQAANLFANDLYDELISCGILDSPDILCNQTDNAVTLTESPRGDHNFILWSLIPYIAARSSDKLIDKHISFDEVATIRPDGGHNIVHATIMPKERPLQNEYPWCGPMWENNCGRILWRIDSEWSDRNGHDGYMAFQHEAQRILSLYAREFDGCLSKDEYAWLEELGYVKTNGDYDGNFKSSWQIVILANKAVQNKLFTIGERLKEKHDATFKALKAPYIEAVLKSVPAHMRKAQEYSLQFLFHSDGPFIHQCISTLLKNGKLKKPTKGQRKSLMTLIVNE